MTKLFKHDFFLLFVLYSLTVIQFDIFGLAGIIAYGILIAYGIIFLAVNLNKVKSNINPATLFATAYFLSFLCSLAINGSIYISGATLFQYLIITISCSMFQDNETIDLIAKLSKFLTVIGIIFSLGSLAIALATFYFPDVINNFPEKIANDFRRFTGSFPSRITGMNGNANTSAGVIYTTATFSFYVLLSKSFTKKWHILSAVNILLAVYSIFFGMCSRTFMLAFCGFSVAFILICSRFSEKGYLDKKRIQKISLFLIIIFLVMTIIVFAIPFVRVFFFDHVLRISSLKTGSGRLGIYKTALELLHDNGIFGVNLDLFKSRTGVTLAHNNFLEILTFGGWHTLILYLATFFYSFFLALKILKEHKNFSSDVLKATCFFLCYLIGHLIIGMSESDINRMKLTSIMLFPILAFISVMYKNKTQVLS